VTSFLEYLYKSQRRCLLFIEKPDMQLTEINSSSREPQILNDDFHEYAPWVDAVKLSTHVLHLWPANEESKPVENITKLQTFNQRIIEKIEACAVIVKPYTFTAIAIGEEKVSTVINRYEKAASHLAELKLSSFSEIYELVKAIPIYFNEKKLLVECVSIFSLPAPDAIEAFKRLFLTLQLLDLIILKALNKVANNAMASSSEWPKFKRLIDEMVIVEFNLENNGGDIVRVMSATSFSQENLMLTMLESEKLLGDLVAYNLRNIIRREKDIQFRSLGQTYIAGYQKLTSLIKKLNAHSVLSHYQPKIPSRTEYVKKVIYETKDFFHFELIKDEFDKIAVLQSDKDAVETVFYQTLKETCECIVPVLTTLLDSATVAPTLLKELGLKQSADKTFIIEEYRFKHRFVNLVSLSYFFMGLNEKDLSGVERKENILKQFHALTYLRISFEYSIDYNALVLAHEDRLTLLKNKICPVSKPTTKKNKNKSNEALGPASPAQTSQTTSSVPCQLQLAEDQVMLKLQREQQLQDLQSFISQIKNKNNELERKAALPKKGKVTNKLFFPDFAQRLQDISDSVTAISSRMKTTIFNSCNSHALQAEMTQVELKLTQISANQRSTASYFYAKSEEKPAALAESKDEVLRSPSRHSGNGGFFKNGKATQVAKQSRPSDSKRSTP
jgi:hypothetical protein